jgi:guanosine-3',5'-bis(diphosphate) 3'-pyrophosphohydrolase
MEDVLEKVKAFATKAHGDQRRKYTPEPYIVHPIRVMELCRKHTASLPILSAALLHDVLEDTQITEEEMHGFLSTIMKEEEAAQTLQLVVELTDVYTKAAYPQWNRKKRKEKEREHIAQTSAESQTVKYADIIDNSIEIVLHDEEFGPKFLKECKALLAVMPIGNATLYLQAKEVVQQNLKKGKESAE